MLGVWEKGRDYFLNLSLNFLMVYIIISHHKIISLEIYSGRGIHFVLCNCMSTFDGKYSLSNIMNFKILRIYSVIPMDNLYKDCKM